jgi:hypothetical protein
MVTVNIFMGSLAGVTQLQHEYDEWLHGALGRIVNNHIDA